MTDEHFFLLMIAVIGFGGQIGAQIIISVFQVAFDKRIKHAIDATHSIVNSQRTEMIAKIEKLERILRDKEIQVDILRTSN